MSAGPYSPLVDFIAADTRPAGSVKLCQTFVCGPLQAFSLLAVRAATQHFRAYSVSAQTPYQSHKDKISCG